MDAAGVGGEWKVEQERQKLEAEVAAPAAREQAANQCRL